jgi:hypothetical protein
MANNIWRLSLDADARLPVPYPARFAERTYQLLRRTLAARRTFFDDLRALTRYWVFDAWDQLFDFMIRGLQLAPPPA